jgi:hypothetical protein
MKASVLRADLLKIGDDLSTRRFSTDRRRSDLYWTLGCAFSNNCTGGRACRCSPPHQRVDALQETTRAPAQPSCLLAGFASTSVMGPELLSCVCTECDAMRRVSRKCTSSGCTAPSQYEFRPNFP